LSRKGWGCFFLFGYENPALSNFDRAGFYFLYGLLLLFQGCYAFFERPLDHFSFPSGHTLHAVMVTITLGYIQPLLLILMLPFTILVALSRMILGLHYPSDVIVGAVIGASVASCIILLAPSFNIIL
jgi:membrane-associated phospholipid phosphatase